jgi:hypothetical protein
MGTKDLFQSHPTVRLMEGSNLCDVFSNTIYLSARVMTILLLFVSPNLMLVTIIEIGRFVSETYQLTSVIQILGAQHIFCTENWYKIAHIRQKESPCA